MSKKTPDEWLEDIDNGLEFRETFGIEQAWPDLENDYFNRPKSAASIGPNLIYAMGDSLISGITVPRPEIVVEAKHPNFVNKAPIVESLDNAFIEDLKMKLHVGRAMVFNFLKGRAILKIGYDSEFGWNPILDVGLQADAQSGQQPSLLGMSLSQFDDRGNRIEFANTQPGMPWIAAVNPSDIVVPWGCVDLETAPWVAHRIIRPNSAIKKDRKYKNTRDLEPDKTMEDFIESYRYFRAEYAKRRHYKSDFSHNYNKDPKYNELWEIHDRSDNTVKVISKNYDKYLRNDPNLILKICGMPFVSTTFVDHPYSFWTTPAAFYLKQVQNKHQLCLFLSFKLSTLILGYETFFFSILSFLP